MGITILYGMVNGSQGRDGVAPAAFSYLFVNNQIVRSLGTVCLALIYLVRHGFKAPKNNKFFLLAIFPSYMFLVFFISGTEGMSDGILGTIIKITDIIAFYLLIHIYQCSTNDSNKILLGFSYLGILFILINIATLIIDKQGAFRGERFRGIMLNVNWTGTYLAFFISIFISQYLSNTRKLKLVWLIATITAILLLILTGSRSALLSATVGMVIIFRSLLKSKRSSMNSVKEIISSIIFILIGIFLYIIYNRESFEFVEKRLHSNQDTRSAVYINVWYQWCENGFFLGLQNELYSVESVYLSALYVYGVIGLCVLIIVFSVIVYKSIKINKLSTDDCGPTGLAIVGIFIVNAILENIYFGTMAAFNLFFYIAIALVMSNDKSSTIKLINNDIS